MHPPQSLLEYESKLWADGLARIAGIDEAGRGPLAGPVVAAALIFSRDFAENEYSNLLEGLTDSKKLTEARREHFFQILSESDDVESAVGIAGPDEIDEINILNATHLAMARATEGLHALPDHILVDGLAVKGLPCESTPIVKGDSLSLSIAAASVIAKVTRDRMMRALHEQYPQYGFDSHKGYGSKRHMQSLLEYGPSPVHRRSFRPVREAFQIHERRDKRDSSGSSQLEMEIS